MISLRVDAGLVSAFSNHDYNIRAQFLGGNNKIIDAREASA
jgi:hypothetical protein